jgi:dehydrogenase/reductase SDR family protein 7
MLDLNVMGTISLTKAVLPSMLARGAGHFVVVSSVAGRMPSPVSGSYSMSKHALQGFFDTLRLETGSRGIAVTCICPGPVQSEGTQNAFTGTPGQIVGEANVDDSKKLSGARCAELMAAAMFFQQPESWISRNPILLFMYVSQYWPDLARRLGHLASAKRVEAFLAGNNDINAGLKMNVPRMLYQAFFPSSR